MSRSQVLSLLKGEVVSRVRFTIGTNSGSISVDGSTFRRVARAIQAGSVSLHVVEQSQMPLTGAGAVYYSRAGTSNNAAYTAAITANSLFTQPLRGRVEEGLLVHESVHASLDLTRSSGILTVWDEAACYIAEILYCRRMGLRRTRISETIRLAALPAVNSIIRTGSAAAAELTNLVTTITNHPLYAPNATICYSRDG